MRIPYSLFRMLLQLWTVFDDNPPFTAEQLAALAAGDVFEVIDWQAIFGVRATPLATALERTFRDPRYCDVVLEF